MTDVIEALSRRIVATGVGTSKAINPFWREQLERLQALLEEGGELAPEMIRDALGYNQRRLPPEVKSNRAQTRRIDRPSLPAGPGKALARRAPETR